MLEKYVHVGIRYFVLSVWTVVGFIMWVPLLARMIALYVASVTASLYTKHDPTPARMALAISTDFYSAGFRQISEQLSSAPPDHSPVLSNEATDWMAVLKEMLFTIFFWASILLLFGWWLVDRSSVIAWTFSLAVVVFIMMVALEVFRVGGINKFRAAMGNRNAERNVSGTPLGLEDPRPTMQSDRDTKPHTN